jgi:hypothetical protein
LDSDRRARNKRETVMLVQKVMVALKNEQKKRQSRLWSIAV